MAKRKARMFAVRRRHGDLVCIMRTKALAIGAAEILSGQTWRHLVDVDGCEVVRVKVDVPAYAVPPGVAMFEPGEADLWGQFARGQTFVVLPRSLMHEMPDDWKSRAAELLDEWDSAWTWPDDFPRAYVQARSVKNLFTSWPAWLLEYKYRSKNRDQIEALRSEQSEIN